MSSYVRGVAVIINIREFGGNKQKTRKGSEFDVVRLERLFTQLRFEIIKWNTKEKCKAEVNIIAFTKLGDFRLNVYVYR